MNVKFDKIFQVFEAHVDKLVLGVIGIVALFLLWVYVIGNPYGVKVDGKTMGPPKIDPHVKRKAEQLAAKLRESASPLPDPVSAAREYEQKLQSAMPNITGDLVIPYPGIGEEGIVEDRLYAIPVIPDLTDVQLENMRGAARVPDEDVRPDRPYESVPGTQADVDLVTVSARLDIETLYNNFETSFLGPRLKSSWKDARLAKPVFARLFLQRRLQSAEGQWGPWQDVSPSKVETYRKRLVELPFKLSESQYGVDIWKAQFDDPKVQREILQPPSYKFTISRTEWMPPEYLIETLNIMEETEKKEKREELEGRRSRTERTTDRRRTTQRPTTRKPEQRGRGRDPIEMGMGMEMGGVGMTLKPQKPKERTVEGVAKDFEKEVLDEKFEIKSRREPLLIWATDDTVEPGQTYQYRIRLGVFNPIAGKDWFENHQAEYKDQIVLWSQFAEPADTVTVPRRFYVFPTDVLAAADDAGGTQGAKVEVMKYHLGRWRDYEFDVYPGETIGYEVDMTEDEETQTPEMMTPDLGRMMGGGVEQVDNNVDFSTGYTLIDIRNKISWGGRLRPDSFSQLLYFDGLAMQILPVGQGNWERMMRDQYRDIQSEMEKDVQHRGAGTMEGMGGMEGMGQDMMMMF